MGTWDDALLDFVLRQAGLHVEFQASLGYIVRLSAKEPCDFKHHREMEVVIPTLTLTTHAYTQHLHM